MSKNGDFLITPCGLAMAMPGLKASYLINPVALARGLMWPIRNLAVLNGLLQGLQPGTDALPPLRIKRDHTAKIECLIAAQHTAQIDRQNHR